MTDLATPIEATGKDEDFNAYYEARPTEALLEKSCSVQVVGKRCVYVNDYRVAGGKPYYSENLPTHRFDTTVRQALEAFSDRDLEAALRERRERKEYFAVWHAARKAANGSECQNCDGTDWVCENHGDRPWGGLSARKDACECGAGMLCPVCRDQRDGWSPIACYREEHDGREVLIAGGSYYYDAETFQIERPFDGVALARLSDGEWCGGSGSEYDGQYWHKPQWFLRIPPRPAQAPETEDQ